MARRRSRSRRRNNKNLWIILGVTGAAVIVVGVLIAISARPSIPAVAVETNYEGIEQSIVDTDNAPGVALGNPDAAVTVVEYSDFSCPHCFDLSQDAMEPLIDQYVRSGDLRIIYKPISFVNPPYSRPAAQAFLCAAESGKGWEMHDQIWALYDSAGAGAYTQSAFVQQAEAIGLDADEFRQCFSSGAVANDVQNVLTEAQVVGVSGTPTLFLNGQPLPYQGPEAAYAEISLMVEQTSGQ